MNLINPYEKLYGLVPLFTNNTKFICTKFIEECGRTCYKSEDKITDDSCIKFVDKIIERKHLTVIEHSNLVVRLGYKGLKTNTPSLITQVQMLKSDFMSYDHDEDYIYIGGNLRAWMELLDFYDINDIADAVISYVSEYFLAYPTMKYSLVELNQLIPETLRRYTVLFVNDRAFSHELVRHRLCVFSQESQRYVRYDDGATFIIPYQYRANDMPQRFIDYLEGCVVEYRIQRKEENNPPELARTCLPNCTKTEVCTTADYIEWEHIFSLRSAKAAHPDMRESMNRIMEPIHRAIRI